MPFMGLNRITGKKVNILNVADPKSEWSPDDIACPHCGTTLIIRRAHVRKGKTT